MRFAKTKTQAQPKSSNVLYVGYGATIDCALLVVAQELGLFQKHGLSVRLKREVGGATIREKLLREELDAAAAPASMLFSIYCGIGITRRPCLTGMLLGFNGSAITLSKELAEMGARDAVSLGRIIRQQKEARVFNFGVVLQVSPQNWNLRKWLRTGGVDPDKDVRTVIIPSALVYEMFLAGHLDGYCVSEPWNSAAALSGKGWIAAATSEIEPEQPEKVLLVLEDFAVKREEEHLLLIASLIEASWFCDVPVNRPEIARMLAQPRYFDLDQKLLANALQGPLDTGAGIREVKDFVVYDARRVGPPNRSKGKGALDLMQMDDARASHPTLRSEVIGKLFREDIFHKASRLAGGPPPRESLEAESPEPPVAETANGSGDKERKGPSGFELLTARAATAKSGRGMGLVSR